MHSKLCLLLFLEIQNRHASDLFLSRIFDPKNAKLDLNDLHLGDTWSCTLRLRFRHLHCLHFILINRGRMNWPFMKKRGGGGIFPFLLVLLQSVVPIYYYKTPWNISGNSPSLLTFHLPNYTIICTNEIGQLEIYSMVYKMNNYYSKKVFNTLFEDVILHCI